MISLIRRFLSGRTTHIMAFILCSTDGAFSARAQQIRRGLGAMLFSFCATLLFLAKIPYGFETNDQLQYLLLPYRYIYDPFLIGDWFTWQTAHYHPSFAYIIRGIHYLSGETGFPVAVFVVHVSVLFALAYACLRAAKAMKLHWFSAAVAVITVSCIRLLGIGGAVVNHGVLLPADMALPFLVLGFSLWMEDKRLRAGLLLGLAGLLHANFAVIGPLVIAIPEIITLARTGKVIPSLKLAGGFMLIAWPSLLSAAFGFFAADKDPDALRILFEYRSPHHYNPPFSTGIDVYWPFVLLACAVPVWMSRAQQGAGRVNAVILALIGSQVIAFIATVFLDNPTVIRLFLWRLSIPLILFSAAAFGESLVTAVRTRKPFDIAFAGSALVLVAAFAGDGQVQWAPEISFKGFGLLIPFAACLAIAPWLLKLRSSVARYGAVVVAAVPLVVAVVASTDNPLMEKDARIDWQRAARHLQESDFPTVARILGKKKTLPIFSWIDRHTPKNAVFLVPPGMDDFRLQARRGIFVDWKCCPMKGDEIAEWARRMNLVMGTRNLPAEGYTLHRVSNSRYLSRSLSSLADLAEREGLTHILARASDNVPRELEKLVTKGGWTLYRLR